MTRPRGRPKGDVETGVITVRLPKAMIAHLDRYIARLASQTGEKANRNTVMRQMLAHSLIARPEPSPPAPLPEGNHRTTEEHQQQTLGQWTHELSRRSLALRTHSQQICRRTQQLQTESHNLYARSRQIQRAAQAVLWVRRDSREMPDGGSRT
jgi:hypothetical protein